VDLPEQVELLEPEDRLDCRVHQVPGMLHQGQVVHRELGERQVLVAPLASMVHLVQEEHQVPEDHRGMMVQQDPMVHLELKAHLEQGVLLVQEEL